MVPPEEKSSMLGVVEIWTSPAALSALQSKPEYKDYFGTVRREGLYDPSQDVTAWYPTAGFVARKTEKETPKAGIVMLAKFVCKDGEGVREKLVDVLGWVCSCLGSVLFSRFGKSGADISPATSATGSRPTRKGRSRIA